MYQIINQTDEEKFEMYMKLKKKKLVKMLIEAHKILDLRPLVVISENKQYNPPFILENIN